MPLLKKYGFPTLKVWGNHTLIFEKGNIFIRYELYVPDLPTHLRKRINKKIIA